MKQIEYYYTTNGKCPYAEWFNDLDYSIQVKVNKRVKRLSEGSYGDHKHLQNSELSEIRLDFGAGYRIYYYDLDTTLILFVAGSNKKEQNRVIQKANEYFKDYCERTDYEQ